MPSTLDALSTRWARSWPTLRPVGHEIRCDRERWVRFHALPESKRYPENEREYAEVLRRHNLLLGELAGRTSPSLLVMTVAWSHNATPAARDSALVRAVPEASLWTSILRERDGDDEVWTHIYVTPYVWRLGALDSLLRLVADGATADVLIADEQFHWLVHPYDGGLDVVTRSTEDRDQLRHQHSDWLSADPSGL